MKVMMKVENVKTIIGLLRDQYDRNINLYGMDDIENGSDGSFMITRGGYNTWTVFQDGHVLFEGSRTGFIDGRLFWVSRNMFTVNRDALDRHFHADIVSVESSLENCWFWEHLEPAEKKEILDPFNTGVMNHVARFFKWDNSEEKWIIRPPISDPEPDCIGGLIPRWAC